MLSKWVTFYPSFCGRKPNKVAHNLVVLSEFLNGQEDVCFVREIINLILDHPAQTPGC